MDSLYSNSSPSVKIQIMGGKVYLRCKGKTLLGLVNKLLKTKSLYVCEKCVLKRRHKMLQQFCMWICSLKLCFYADVHWKLKVWVQGFRKRGCQGCHWHPQGWHPQEDEFILFQIGRTEFDHPLLLAPPTIFTFRHPWIDLDRNPSICFCLSS